MLKKVKTCKIANARGETRLLFTPVPENIVDITSIKNCIGTVIQFCMNKRNYLKIKSCSRMNGVDKEKLHPTSPYT